MTHIIYILALDITYQHEQVTSASRDGRQLMIMGGGPNHFKAQRQRQASRDIPTSSNPILSKIHNSVSTELN